MIDNLLEQLSREGELALDDIRDTVKRKWALTRVRWGVSGFAIGAGFVLLFKGVF